MVDEPYVGIDKIYITVAVGSNGSHGNAILLSPVLPHNIYCGQTDVST